MCDHVLTMTSTELAEILRKLRERRTDNVAVEAKAASWDLPRDLWQTISAFSNSPGGGVVILGLDEQQHFKVTGLVDAKKTQADFSALCTLMEPPLRPVIDLQSIEGSDVLVADIAELRREAKPCYLKSKGLTGGAFVRVGDSNRQLTEYEIQMLLASRGQPLEDVKPVPGTTRADLDDALVKALLGTLGSRGGSFVDVAEHEALRRLRVLVADPLGAERVSLGGLLALGRHPQQYLPQLRVTFVSYATEAIGEQQTGGARFLDNASFEGSIPSMVVQALARVEQNMRRGATVEGAFRKDRLEYPEIAVREAIVNALVHRDFSDSALGTPTQIQKFPDRLEIQNPGGLFGPVTVEELGEAGVTAARNAFLLRLLEDLHICESRGSGIGTMVSAMRNAGLRPPNFEDRISFFRVTFPNHSLMDEETSNWLSQLPQRDLTASQRAGLALMRETGAVTNSTYRRATGVDSRVASRELADLTSRGVAIQIGSRRWATYELADQNRAYAQLPLPQTESGAAEIRPAPEDEGLIDKRVLGALRRFGPLTRSELEAHLHMPARGSRRAVERLLERGEIAAYGPPRSTKRRYGLPGQSLQSTTRTGP